MDRQEELQRRLLATFRQEAGDHLQTLIAGLLQFEEQSGDQAAVLDAVFRAAHSLKGAASVVGLAAVTALCQAMESYFAAVRKDQGQVDARAIEVLHIAANHLGRLLSQPNDLVTDDSVLHEIIGSIEQCQRAIQPAAAPSVPPRTPEPAGEEPASVRVSAAKVSTILWQAEQLVGAKLTGAWLSDELGRVQRMLTQARLRQLRQSRALPPPVAAGAARQEGDDEAAAILLFSEVEPLLASLSRVAANHQRQWARSIDELVEEVKSLSLSPVQTLLGAFPKVVRDLAHEMGKQARLQVEGGDLELDRRILDQLRDPLLHLLRNAVAHGLERPQQRGGKNPVGLIRIAVRPVEGQRVEFVIRDDGAGIDVGRVGRVAVASGYLTADKLEAMSEQARLELVFLPGMSTREQADRVSGRGLGLSIVQEKVQALGGTFSVASTPGEGTTFRLYLPMRVATLRGVQVEVGQHLLIIPENDIDRVGRLPAESVRQVGGRRVVDHAGRALPLLRLAELMRMDAVAPDAQKRFLPVVYVGTPEPMLILQVDAVQGEQEFLLKSLHPPLCGIRWYSGMTVNGQGRVIPILQTAELVRAMAAALAPGAQGAPSGEAAGPRAFSILLAEDSITSRIFLKNLLEAMGHTVVSVGDGDEAWNELRRGSFDLLLTDVEMPVLDGYMLTEKVRAEPRLAELPVILVTALDSPQHRQRGLAAGADAYLVKNQFDHEQLLDTITRLVLR